MKERFLQIYNNIVSQDNVKKMEVLGSVTKDAVLRVMELDKTTAHQLMDRLESTQWCNYLSESEAEAIVSKMDPACPWRFVIWKPKMQSLQLQCHQDYVYNEYAMYTAMCMVVSDDGETIAQIMGQPYDAVKNTDTFFINVYKLALDKLTDKDGVFDIRRYFKIKE